MNETLTAQDLKNLLDACIKPKEMKVQLIVKGGIVTAYWHFNQGIGDFQFKISFRRNRINGERIPGGKVEYLSQKKFNELQLQRMYNNENYFWKGENPNGPIINQ